VIGIFPIGDPIEDTYTDGHVRYLGAIILTYHLDRDGLETSATVAGVAKFKVRLNIEVFAPRAYRLFGYDLASRALTSEAPLPVCDPVKPITPSPFRGPNTYWTCRIQLPPNAN